MALKFAPLSKGKDYNPFMKPQEFTDYAILIVAPTELRENVPGKDFHGAPVERDIMEAHIAAFHSRKSLAEGDAATVGVWDIDKVALVNALKPSVGGVTASVVKKIQKKGGGLAWVFEAPDVPDLAELVTAWLEAHPDFGAASDMSEPDPWGVAASDSDDEQPPF